MFPSGILGLRPKTYLFLTSRVDWGTQGLHSENSHRHTRTNQAVVWPPLLRKQEKGKRPFSWRDHLCLQHHAFTWAGLAHSRCLTRTYRTHGLMFRCRIFILFSILVHLFESRGDRKILSLDFTSQQLVSQSCYYFFLLA